MFSKTSYHIEISQLICKANLCQRLQSKACLVIMSGVCFLSTTADIAFIVPKLYLEKSIKKQLNFSNSIFCSMWKTDQLFIIFFTYHSEKYLMKAFFLYYKSTLWRWRCSIIYYYLSPLIIDLSHPKVLYKSVLLSSKNVALCKLTSLIIPKNVF